MVRQSIARRTAFVRVIQVRVQNKNGVIFRGQRITSDGEILDTSHALIVRIQSHGIGVTVLPGQWWSVAGKTESRTFINSGGFEITEDQMEVEPGDAALCKPSGIHVVEYLARNPRFEGIGKITAERLWETFGDALFGILDNGDTTALANVIKPQRATRLVQGWQEEGLSNSLQWLQGHGIGITIGRRILGYFGSEASEKIYENPYRLLSFSAGWSEVDKIAKEQFGVERDDERRLAAAIEETVYRRFSLGDTYVPRANLVAGLGSILTGEQHSWDLIEKAIAQSEATGRLLYDHDGNAYSLGASILENKVVDCIRERLGRKGPPCDVNVIIHAYEEREGNGFRLNKEQREAVHLITKNDFAVVTGGAGCGKTTVLKCIYEVLEAQGYHITQLALAGKAVKRMMEATGRPAITLASFIKRMKEVEGRNEANETGRMALLIDEASMVDLISFSGAIRFVNADSKIVLIGDPHQLPPVGPGLILHCLVEIPELPHVELKIAKRFGNEIADIANSVKDGTFPAPERFTQQVRFIEVDEADMGPLGEKLYLEQPEDTVVLCATRKVAGMINQMVQGALSSGRKPLRLWNVEQDMWEHAGFYESDLLICTQNHWDIGIQNGSIGQLIEIEDALTLNGEVAGELPVLGWVLWDDGEKRPLHENLLDSLELGYALTVHKAQGSQWRRVVICLPTKAGSRSPLIERSLVYTALTRAQSEIIVLGHHARLAEAVVHRKAADRRKVGLPRRLAQMLSV